MDHLIPRCRAREALTGHTEAEVPGLEGSMLSAPELSGESKTDLSPRTPLGFWVHGCMCSRTQGSPTSLSLWGSVPALASRLRRPPVSRASLVGQRPLRPAELCSVEIFALGCTR